MTGRRDPDDLIKTFLEDGPEELSDRAYDAVRAEIDHTRQRALIGPWRVPTLNNYARYAIAAAAVLLVAVIGINLIPRSSGVGEPGATATPTAAATPSATAEPPTRAPSTPEPSDAAVRLPFADGDIAAGTYFMDDFTTTRRTYMQFTVPAGWRVDDPGLRKGTNTATEVLFTPWVLSHIFANGCQWNALEMVEVSSVDEIVNALAEQLGREASVATDVMVGGLEAKRMELTVSPDLDTSTCTNGNQRYWPGAGPDMSSGLCCDPAGNIDVVYVVDAAAAPLVLVARHYPGSLPEHVAELQSIIDSIQINP
jgi:hypothetical protein